MRIVLGADHRGYKLKKELVELLQKMDHEVHDVGTNSEEPCDYPLIAHKVAEIVSRGDTPRGILACKSGIGMSIAANKVKGIRAALCHSVKAAEISRLHNNSNILVLSADELSNSSEEIVRSWLETAFEGGRHKRRVDQITDIEKKDRK
jgi:ribose 5-phosphate isomerase B